jgi:saccharopine dehydrogenase-like NADP-dependent oxidoreductase
MKKILVLGAGLSSSYLLKYLTSRTEQNKWHVTVADTNKAAAALKIEGTRHTTALALNANDNSDVEQAVSTHDIVISLLPPFMHTTIARACITFKKHLITASYVSDEMQQLNADALKAGVLLLNECGLDPGIDHLSAMKMIHEIKAKGGTVDVFKSFCGGLIAPEFDDNPWNYKFTWNPRNVVVAGQATAKYIERDELKFIPASRIFTQTEPVFIAGYGNYESYANRDSLSYIKPYGIQKAHTVLRGTLRKQGYAAAWNNLVKLGLTDDSFVIHDADLLTYRQWLSAFTPGNGLDRLEQRVCDFLELKPDGEEFKKLQWLGIFDEIKITLKEASPALILQQLLQQKWKLNKGELDMIVMYHEVEATINQQKQKYTSTLVVKGETEVLTAMSKTVGLPMAISCKLILEGKIEARGVQIPIMPELYNPVLQELEEFGVTFTETTEAV